MNMISLIEKRKMKKLSFFTEKQLVREHFKVAHKEIGKEKIILRFFSSISIFSSRHVLV